MTANNTADQNKYKCFNAFKEKGYTYYYDDIIEEAEYQSISENNKKWFYPVTVPLAPQSMDEFKKVDGCTCEDDNKLAQAFCKIHGKGIAPQSEQEQGAWFEVACSSGQTPDKTGWYIAFRSRWESLYWSGKGWKLYEGRSSDKDFKDVTYFLEKRQLT